MFIDFDEKPIVVSGDEHRIRERRKTTVVVAFRARA